LPIQQAVRRRCGVDTHQHRAAQAEDLYWGTRDVGREVGTAVDRPNRFDGHGDDDVRGFENPSLNISLKLLTRRSYIFRQRTRQDRRCGTIPVASANPYAPTQSDLEVVVDCPGKIRSLTLVLCPS
jgi:hypothetical protein